MATTRLRLGWSVLAAGLIAAAAGFAPVYAAQQTVPTFGTTVAEPGGLRGVIYPVTTNTRALPDFQGLTPIGVVYTSTLNVPPLDFREGFPGVTNRSAWFAIDYSGQFWIENAGMYTFELTSDDGSKLYIDDRLVVNNDGIHRLRTRTGNCALTGGIHRIRVSYFQGPVGEVALMLRVARPSQELRTFDTNEFKPPANPADWKYPGQLLHLSSASGAPGDKVRLQISSDSDTAKAPPAVKWELAFPAQLLELQGDGPEVGSAVTDSGKSLTCLARRPYVYSCSLRGGRNPIADGPIAIFNFKIQTTAEPGTATVRIEKAVAVAADSKETALTGAEGTVTIR